jgi:drug/metabolite transporter (DMT)-like permease
MLAGGNAGGNGRVFSRRHRISFTAPFIVGALAGPVLGERVDLTQWLAIAVGFGGALLVIRPFGEATSIYALLVLGSAACYAGLPHRRARDANSLSPAGPARWRKSASRVTSSTS